jgi:hypothetical protein
VNPMDRDQKAIKRVEFRAFRKPPSALAVSSRLSQGEFEREVSAEMGRQKRVSALLLFKCRHALVEGSANLSADPIDCGIDIFRQSFRAYEHSGGLEKQQERPADLMVRMILN